MNRHSLFAAEILDHSRHTLAADVMARLVERDPDALDAYRRAGLGEPATAVATSLSCLADATAVERPALFLHDVAWRRVAMHARGTPPAHLEHLLEATEQALVDALPPTVAPSVCGCVRMARAELPRMPTSLPTCLPEGALRAPAQRYLLAVLENRPAQAWDVLDGCLQTGVEREVLVRDVLVATQAEVGRMWQMNELSVVEEHMATEVAEVCLSRLYRTAPPVARLGGRVLTTSVAGDQHRLGPRWLALAFESAGWEVVALGADLPTDELMHAVVEFDVDAVCLAATLVSSVRAVAGAIAAVRALAGGRRRAILVGGPPFRLVEDLWQVVGADATASDPAAAVGAAASALA